MLMLSASDQGAPLVLDQEQPEHEALEQDDLELPFTFDKVVVNVTDYVNIREGMSAKSELLGRLSKGGYATIIERGDEWTKIESGSVTGYIFNEYLLFDKAAKNYLAEHGAQVTVLTADNVNIRSAASTESVVLGKGKAGASFESIDTEHAEGWNAIDYNGETAYVSAELSKIQIDLPTAVTVEQIKAAEREAAAAALAKAAKKAMESAKLQQPAQTNRAPISLSDEDLFLMATVVASEALSESYQGKLAVANVIINRMRDGSWGSTVRSVVYAKGQFAGANSGRFERFAKLVNEDCKRAAVEAAAGNNNIDNYLYFRMKNIAQYSKYSKYYILGNHVFHMP
jgi:spore germination cell wall hydrolase CwlJ-like protein